MIASGWRVVLGLAGGVLLLGLSGCRSIGALRQKCLAGDTPSCESACRKGQAGEGGCFHAAEQHRERAGLDFANPDWKRSADLYRQSCDGGYADGCLFAALAVESPYAAIDAKEGPEPPRMIGDGEVRTRENRLTKACSLGSIAGCKKLGDVLIGKAAERAKAAYQKACRAGTAAGACEAARAHEVDVAEQFRVACTHRQADDCTNLGNLLFLADPPRAVRLFASESELRGVAALAGGQGSFIRARERQANQGISLPRDASARSPAVGAASVDAHATGVKGEVAFVEVDRALSQRRDDLATCLAALPKELAVKVALGLIVDLTGDVWRATIAEGSVPQQEGSCVVAVLEGLSFSAPHDGVATVDVSLSRPALEPSLPTPSPPRSHPPAVPRSH